MNRLVVVLAGVLTLAGVPPASSQQPKIVYVGGRAVEVIEMGTGVPTLVLETGVGDGASVWRGVLPELAKHTHVIAYSRAGHGRSGPITGVATPGESVRELHALLGAMRERAPVVLAGHSWGGLLARLYASTYPADVAGIVLIDGSHELQWRRWEALRPSFHILDTVRALMPKMPPSGRADFAQMLAVETSGRVEGMRPLPDIPLAVITAQKPCAPEREWTCRAPRALAVWRELHGEWAARSTNSIHLVSARTEHYVMNDQPELVVQAVRFVLGATRPTKR